MPLLSAIVGFHSPEPLSEFSEGEGYYSECPLRFVQTEYEWQAIAGVLPDFCSLIVLNANITGW